MTTALGRDADSSPHHTPTAVTQQPPTENATSGICPFACSEACSTSCPYACVLLVPSGPVLPARVFDTVRRLSWDGWGLWAAAEMYIAARRMPGEFATGLLPAVVCRRIGGARLDRAVAELVAAGLWAVDGPIISVRSWIPRRQPSSPPILDARAYWLRFVKVGTSGRSSAGELMVTRAGVMS